MKYIVMALMVLILSTIFTNLLKIYMPRTYKILELLNWNTWAWRLEGSGHGTAAVLLKATCNVVFTFGFGLVEIAIIQNFM